MTSGRSDRRPDPAALAPLVVALGAAVVVAVEFVAIGLAPVMASRLGWTAEQAGWLVTWFAIGSAVMGPFAALLSRRLRADHAMAIALAPFAVGILASEFADPWQLYLLRFVQGATLPLFIAVASEALTRVLGRDDRAVAVVYLGVTVGGVLGAPAGAALAAVSGWAMPFVLLGGLALVTALWLLKLPVFRIREPSEARVFGEVAALLRPSVLLHLAISLLQFAAMFCTYAFIGTILEADAQSDQAIGFWLLVFGLGGLAGNMAAGLAAKRSTHGPTIVTVLVVAGSSLAAPCVPGHAAVLLPLMAFWGAAHAAAFVLCQLRVTRAAATAPRLAATMNISACNVGISLGSALGGWTVSQHGPTGPGWPAFGLGLLALGLLLAAPRRRGRGPAAQATEKRPRVPSPPTSCPAATSTGRERPAAGRAARTPAARTATHRE